MAKAKRMIKLYLDPVANTLNIWWDDPKYAYTSEEVDSPYSNDVVIKDRKGRPISLEIIGVFPKELNIVARLKGIIGTKRKEPFLLESRS